MRFLSLIRSKDFYQLRLLLPNWTIRFSAERKHPVPGSIAGGWPKE